MSLETWAPWIITMASGLFATYRWVVEQRDKNQQVTLNLQVQKIQAEISQTDVLSKSQQAFSEELINEAGRLREIAKNLEVAKLADIQLISKISIEKLELELEVKRQKAKVIEKQEEVDDGNDVIKILEQKIRDFEVVEMTLRSVIDQKEREIHGLNKSLGQLPKEG